MFSDSAAMSFDSKFDVLRTISEECSNEERIRMLLEQKSTPVCYVWFLPTPWMHITEVWRYKVPQWYFLKHTSVGRVKCADLRNYYFRTEAFDWYYNSMIL